MGSKTSASPSASLSLRASSSSSVSVCPNCKWMLTKKTMRMPLSSSSSSSISMVVRPQRRRSIRCEVVVEASTMTSSQDEEASAKIGAKVRVKVPLKVYHIPKVPEFDLNGIEGEIKQYVGIWKGKRISANLPYRVQFVIDIEGRGPVKFVAHLKEDEFEYL
ncbi:Ferredoxin thioredoxin reductase, alpha chain [Sesbania bispinosa]|nr:Ferredoxin thioredoxin reductase, alpha chain [Sesbania bispinosa]